MDGEKSPSSHLLPPGLNPETRGTGTCSLQGSPTPHPPPTQRKGEEPTMGGPVGGGGRELVQTRRAEPPGPGTAPGAGDTFAKRIRKAGDGFRAPPGPRLIS